MDSSFLEKYNSGQTILVDKELDWTSFDVIKKLRNLIKCKKIGHAGTLDPLATGLLIICTGKNTKKRATFGHSTIISPDGKILKLKKSGIGIIYTDINPDLSMQLRKIIPSLN